MKTEFEFCLPTGYIDETGQVHQTGIMRRSRAMDEILPMQDPRVQANLAYATVIILSRVMVQLGTITEITPQIIENMFAADLSYLQTLYRQINSPQINGPQINGPQINGPQINGPERLGTPETGDVLDLEQPSNPQMPAPETLKPA